ncbi:PepSY domain-containing protein [Segnochrobactraceae bacterium EtOH-i3]
MKGLWGAVIVAGGLAVAAGLAPTPALADRDCSVPLASWQPREALAAKLRADGWTDFVIRTDDGCYKVKAVNGRGQRMKAKFDPATLERLPSDHDGPHDRDRDDGPGDD